MPNAVRQQTYNDDWNTIFILWLMTFSVRQVTWRVHRLRGRSVIRNKEGPREKATCSWRELGRYFPKSWLFLWRLHAPGIKGDPCKQGNACPIKTMDKLSGFLTWVPFTEPRKWSGVAMLSLRNSFNAHAEVYEAVQYHVSTTKEGGLGLDINNLHTAIKAVKIT